MQGKCQFKLELPELVKYYRVESIKPKSHLIILSGSLRYDGHYCSDRLHISALSDTRATISECIFTILIGFFVILTLDKLCEGEKR